MTELHIRSARPDELGIVEDLLREASAWLSSRGIDQWQYPPHTERIIKAIEKEEVFLAFAGRRPIATLQVDASADPEFWMVEDSPEDALYVHRMAVSRAMAGMGIGSFMLRWAADRAAVASKQWLRLDAWKDNPGLHRYYEKNGFTLVRVVDLPHRRSGALFQRSTPRTDHL